VTIQLLFGDKIRSEVLKILSGECLLERHGDCPHVYILSPWISDVNIEFSDLHISKENKETSFLHLDYNIKSINLSYALLLLKLHGGSEVEKACQVDIVTLPPNESNYSPNYVPRIRRLLDFLDEVGCNVFVNQKLHSKLIYSNDLALLGSCNLSKSALYDKEEIGVTINDLDNLLKLEEYCNDIIYKSEPYGYSCWRNRGPTLYDRYKESFSHDKFTRGWLLDYLVENVYRSGYGEFLDITGGYDRAIESYSRDLNLFYLTSLRRLISSPDHGHGKGKDFVKHAFRYRGDNSIDAIMEFVNNHFARKTVPNIKLRLEPLGQRQ